MKIGLIDVDGHHFPNLALMRISAYHKAMGDDVEWWLGNLWHYDRVYKSKIFSDAYSKDNYDVWNCDEVIQGGTGYCISLVRGAEKFDKTKNIELPAEVEKMFPDYSIYPKYDFAISMTSRGCPRGCDFCHVASKEGRASVKVADVENFWNGQTTIKVLDPNITACKDKRDLFKQYKATGANVEITQGIDIRMVDDEDIEDLSDMKLRELHFAWDNPKDNLESKFRKFAERYHGNKPHGHYGSVYCLTNFNSTMEENLYRIYTLRDLGFNPYVMIYNKPSAPQEVRYLQRWCNNKIIFRSCKRFEDYDHTIG